MQLILHLGTPKTGTTALQEALTALNPRLRERGVLYPLLDTKLPNHNFLALLAESEERMSGLFRYFIKQDPNYLTHRIPKALADLEAQIKQSKPRKVIISSEMIFYALSCDTDGRLRNRLLSLSNDIRLIAYFRRPSRYYLAVAQQQLKNACTIPRPKPMELRKHIENWEKSMMCPMTALCYDRSALNGADITSDFLHRVLDSEELAELDIPIISSNETLSAEAMEVIQDYRRAIYPESNDERFEDNNALRKALAALEPSVRPSTKPQLHAEIAEYIDYSSTELLWLRERYGVTFPDLDYARIADRAPPNLADKLRVSDICPVDSERKNVLYAHALKLIHDQLANKLAKRKRKQRSLIGLFR